MLMTFGILLLRRLMRQIAERAIPSKSGLNLITSTNKVSQKGMTYETLFACFRLFQKGAFLRQPEHSLISYYKPFFVYCLAVVVGLPLI